MTLKNHETTIAEALGFWTTLRQLGYSSDQIFLVYGPGQAIGLEVRHPIRTFTIHIGLAEKNGSETKKRWEAISAEWNGGVISDDEMTEFILHSKVGERIFKLTWQMAQAGLPTTPEEHAAWRNGVN